MVSPLTLPIARLRASGAKVSTTLGHDPALGIWHYAVTPPGDVGPTEFTDIAQDAQAGVRVSVARDRERVLYEKSVYREGQPAHKIDLAQAERTLAARLASAAGYLEERIRQTDRTRRMTWSGGKR